METEFIYWRHATSPGIMVEEVSGGEDKSGKLWKAMALQVFGENGGDRFRQIAHTAAGAPILEDCEQRISVTHTPHFLAVALLPRTPESDLGDFSLRTAMGIDAERCDRAQVLKVADRVMSDAELQLIEGEVELMCNGDEHRQGIDKESAEIRANILGWTIKEALYKSALQEGLDYRKDLIIESLPEICGFPTVKSPRYGKGKIRRRDAEGKEMLIEMELFSYESEDHIITIAYSPKCAKFKRN